MTTNTKPVAVIIGATSKWQADGRNTQLIHGGAIDDSDLPVGIRFGVGGAIAQKFAQEGFLTVLTTRSAANAASLNAAIREQGGDTLIVELDLASAESISEAFAQIRAEAGDPLVLVYNAGYLEGRDLPPEMELLEHMPYEMFETAQHISSSGPFPGGQGGAAGHAGTRRRVDTVLQQPVLAAGPKAVHRPVPVLSPGDDADVVPGADRRVFGVRRPRRQRGH